MATAATADAVTTPTQAASSTVPTGSWTEVVWVGPRSPGGTRTHLPAVGAAGSALTSACAHAARHSLPIHESGGHTLRSSLGCPIATYCRPRQYKNTCGGGRAMLKYDALPRLGRTRRVCSGMVAFQACSPSDGSKAPKLAREWVARILLQLLYRPWTAREQSSLSWREKNSTVGNQRRQPTCPHSNTRAQQGQNDANPGVQRPSLR